MFCVGLSTVVFVLIFFLVWLVFFDALNKPVEQGAIPFFGLFGCVPQAPRLFFLVTSILHSRDIQRENQLRPKWYELPAVVPIYSEKLLPTGGFDEVYLLLI